MDRMLMGRPTFCVHCRLNLSAPCARECPSLTMIGFFTCNSRKLSLDDLLVPKQREERNDAGRIPSLSHWDSNTRKQHTRCTTVSFKHLPAPNPNHATRNPCAYSLSMETKAHINIAPPKHSYNITTTDECLGECSDNKSCRR